MSTPSGQSRPAGTPGRVEDQLSAALGLLLGRPLDAFDPAATYVLYHWDDVMSAEFTEFYGDFSLLGTIAPALEEDEPYPLGLRWRHDLARSICVLDSAEGFGARAEAALLEASLDPDEIVVRGADLAPLLAGRDELPDDTYMTILARSNPPARSSTRCAWPPAPSATPKG